MSLFVVVNKLRDGIILASGQHTRRRGFGFDYEDISDSTHTEVGAGRRTLLLILWLVGGVWGVAALHKF